MESCPLILFSTFLFSLLLGYANVVKGRYFTLINQCSYPVWPGTITGAGGIPLGQGGFLLEPGASASLPAPSGWSGRFWARTNCTFDPSGAGHCTTGDCAGALQCVTGGIPPVSLAEFTLDGAGGKDFYDVSLVDGYNIGIGVRPEAAGIGDCQFAGCHKDLNNICPLELRVVGPAGEVVACKSACAAFNTQEYCCTGEHSTPATCSPSSYSELFKTACPTAYSYAYDDASSTCTCAGTDYVISFCPSF